MLTKFVSAEGFPNPNFIRPKELSSGLCANIQKSTWVKAVNNIQAHQDAKIYRSGWLEVLKCILLLRRACHLLTAYKALKSLALLDLSWWVNKSLNVQRKSTTAIMPLSVLHVPEWYWYKSGWNKGCDLHFKWLHVFHYMESSNLIISSIFPTWKVKLILWEIISNYIGD